MTDEQVKILKQKTIEELAEQRQRLSFLTAMADEYLQEVASAQDILRRLASKEPLEGNFPTASGWPSHDDLMQLNKDVRNAKERIKLMEQRLRDWGVID